MMVFEIGVLKEIFGLKMDKVTGEWQRLQNKELFDWYSPDCDQTKEIEMGEACGKYGRRYVHTGFWWENLV